ncbi:MAG: hypothetical protein WB392_05535, partial [Methanotrichaceae archaeon]
MNKFNIDRTIKLALIIAFISLSFAFLVAHDTPASGYEPSIYNSTPLIIWIILLLAYFFGILLLIFDSQVSSHNPALYRLTGILLVFIVYISILSLYIIRGYYALNLNSDSASHLRYCLNILSNGYFDKGLVYPILHVYFSQIANITNLNQYTLMNLIPLFFSILYAILI